MMFTITPGPYVAGSRVPVMCHVPRTRGANQSLQLTVGPDVVPASVHNRTDGTQELLINMTLKMTEELNDVDVTCMYQPPNGGMLQKDTIALLAQGKDFSVTVGASVTTGLIIVAMLGLGIYGCYRRQNIEPKDRTDSDYSDLQEQDIQPDQSPAGPPLPVRAWPNVPVTVVNITADDDTSSESEDEDGYLHMRDNMKNVPVIQSARKDSHVSTDISNKTAEDVGSDSTSVDEDGYLPMRDDTQETERKDSCTSTSDNDKTGQLGAQSLETDEYEKLQFNPNEPTEMEQWLQANNVSQVTCQRLRDEMILTLADLRELKDRDINRLALVMGEQLRLRASIRKIQTTE